MNMDEKAKYYFREALIYFLNEDKAVRTQGWLSKKTGISQQTISKILKGVSLGREKNRINIASVFTNDYLSFLKKGEEEYNKKNGVAFLKKNNFEHHSVIDEFEDIETATDFNKILVKIEKIDKKTFERLYKQAKFELSELESPKKDHKNKVSGE